MAERVKAAEKQTADAVKQPVSAWRRMINRTGDIVDKRWRRYRAFVFLLYVIVAAGVFLILAVLARTVAYFPLDVTITHAVQSINAGWFSALMYALTWLGFAPQSYVIAALVLLLLYVSGLKWEAVVTLLSLAGSSALGTIIKLVIVRPRPSMDLVHVLSQLKDYSFPSGHVLLFTSFYGFLIFLVYTLLKSSWWRTLLLVILGGIVALIGLSRIYEGQHWASDVLGAYLIGSLWLALSIIIYLWGKPRFFAHQPVASEKRTSS